jgi:hypothetical protein
METVRVCIVPRSKRSKRQVGRGTAKSGNAATCMVERQTSLRAPPPYQWTSALALVASSTRIRSVGALLIRYNATTRVNTGVSSLLPAATMRFCSGCRISILTNVYAVCSGVAPGRW